MSLTLPGDATPLEERGDGVIYVRGTRVPLETIVGAFEDGETAEEIVQQYPSVALADVYGVIAYYLRHREQVRAYVAVRRDAQMRIRRENEARWDQQGIRERLLPRRSRTA
jgi:uncharacterized protein (DUF433 family)